MQHNLRIDPPGTRTAINNTQQHVQPGSEKQHSILDTGSLQPMKPQDVESGRSSGPPWNMIFQIAA
eukprot:4388300-Amphidinium_carterae.1